MLKTSVPPHAKKADSPLHRTVYVADGNGFFYYVIDNVLKNLISCYRANSASEASTEWEHVQVVLASLVKTGR